MRYSLRRYGEMNSNKLFSIRAFFAYMQFRADNFSDMLTVYLEKYFDAQYILLWVWLAFKIYFFFLRYLCA